MANFEQAHKIVMAHEGGYANNPADRGGETYKGISRKRHPNWPGWALVDGIKALRVVSLDMALQNNLTIQRMVISFYRSQFWDILNLDLISNQAIATELYDTGVNMGTGKAALFLQTALNVSNRNGKDYPDLMKDAQIGAKTVSCLNNHKAPGMILKIINILQGSRYIDIMEADPTQEVFFNSWFSRVAI